MVSVVRNMSGKSVLMMFMLCLMMFVSYVYMVVIVSILLDDRNVGVLIMLGFYEVGGLV